MDLKKQIFVFLSSKRQKTDDLEISLTLEHLMLATCLRFDFSVEISISKKVKMRSRQKNQKAKKS